jgi:hypothetical protein
MNPAGSGYMSRLLFCVRIERSSQHQAIIGLAEIFQVLFL